MNKNRNKKNGNKKNGKKKIDEIKEIEKIIEEIGKIKN